MTPPLRSRTTRSTGFTIGLLAKNVAIAESLAEAMAIDAPLTRLVSARWASARDAVGPTRDNTEAFLAWSKTKKQRT